MEIVKIDKHIFSISLNGTFELVGCWILGNFALFEFLTTSFGSSVNFSHIDGKEITFSEDQSQLTLFISVTWFWTFK